MSIVSGYIKKASPIALKLVDALFPARCAACSEFTGTHGALCAACWRNMHFIDDPVCCKCGLPFEYNIGEGAICGRCAAHPPAYAQARAVFRYDEASKAQILAFKYQDKTQLAPVLGTWLTRIAAPYKDKADVIIPVPLHRLRLLLRRYNQAALLAHELARQTGLPIMPDTLQRKKRTPSQSGLTRKQREDNMRGAFHVPGSKRALVKGKSVLLVDDVLTTGATLETCSRALHGAGAIDVYALTLARTVLAE